MSWSLSSNRSSLSLLEATAPKLSDTVPLALLTCIKCFTKYFTVVLPCSNTKQIQSNLIGKSCLETELPTENTEHSSSATWISLIIIIIIIIIIKKLKFFKRQFFQCVRTISTTARKFPQHLTNLRHFVFNIIY